MYPRCTEVGTPDIILFHTPTLHDRGKPWNPFLSSFLLRRAFPEALFIAVVHEFSEAPRHWRARQAMLARFAHGLVVNSEADRSGLKHWHPKVLRTHLGPTLFYSELLAGGDLPKLRARVRGELLADFGPALKLGAAEKWILHPGLLTPAGKGINFLGKLEPQLPPAARLLIMGGMGPKQQDRDFAQATLASLEKIMKGRLSFIDSPNDETFRKFLLAADLVVLPYDVGVSERRSSFLSAMCCGANVWTTTGEFTPELALSSSGVHSVTAAQWLGEDSGVARALASALAESDEEALKRRLRNLAWANGRSWEKRTTALANFISSL